jgi:hypothetical protein
VPVLATLLASSGAAGLPAAGAAGAGEGEGAGLASACRMPLAPAAGYVVSVSHGGKAGRGLPRRETRHSEAPEGVRNPLTRLPLAPKTSTQQIVTSAKEPLKLAMLAGEPVSLCAVSAPMGLIQAGCQVSETSRRAVYFEDCRESSNV